MKPFYFLLAGASALLVGCSDGDEQAGFAGGPPPMPVLVDEARLETIVETVDLVGSIAANERVDLSPEISGRIRSIEFEEGDQVEKGDLLITIDDSRLRSRLSEAQATFDLAQTSLDRSKQLLERDLIPPQEHDEKIGEYDVAKALLEGAQEDLNFTRIHAPFGGILAAREISPGSYVEPGDILTTLVEINPVKIDFDVPERFLRRLAAGQVIRIVVPAYPDQSFEGEVFFVSPVINRTSRTVEVKAILPNADGLLKPGMFGNLSLSVETREDSVVISESAVFQRGDLPFVYVVNEQNLTELRPVQIGVRRSGEVEILSGVEAGEQVVAEGVQKVFFPGAPVSPSPLTTKDSEL
ncbi:MAG: efflux RND transporter periplasmic adaptor subunit [Verrucomicrobiota bacterium]